MKKRGFTLVELLGVIVVLGLLMLFVFPNVVNQLKKGKGDISSAVETLIFNSAGNYIDGNLNTYPVSTDTTYCLTLEQLVSAGEIKENLLIDDQGKKLHLGKKVEVTIKDGKKSYKMNDECVK